MAQTNQTGPRESAIRVYDSLRRRVKAASALDEQTMAEFADEALRRELARREGSDAPRQPRAQAA